MSPPLYLSLAPFILTVNVTFKSAVNGGCIGDIFGTIGSKIIVSKSLLQVYQRSSPNSHPPFVNLVGGKALNFHFEESFAALLTVKLA